MILKQYAVDIANAFTRWGLWHGGGGGGASALAELTDVEITTPQNEDILQYNGDKWENAQLKEVKVNKSYSTQPRVIGEWIDGKPLYELTIEVNFNLPSQTWGGFTMTDNIDTAVSGKIIDYNNNSYPCVISKDKYVMQFRNVAIDVRKIVIQYTKPTDATTTPVANVLHNYSTNEQIVGAWVDGSPIYEKAFIATSSRTIGQYNWVSISDIPLNNSNCKNIIDIKVINTQAEGGVYYPLIASKNTNDYLIVLGTRPDGTYTTAGSVFVVQYTKP